MKTERFKDDISKAARLIEKGGLVAVPTETVYGLACNGLDFETVSRIYEVKGRPAAKPLSLMIADVRDMDRLCHDIPEQARTLAREFWPGPLTIVLPANEIIPEIVLAGGKTVGLRCPNHPLTLSLLRETGIPLAAPSANPSGEPSPRNAEQVLAYFDGKIDAVIDGGACEIGVASTLIDMSVSPYRILRQGALSQETIAEALAEKMLVIGITGGSGGGKTTALRVLEELGALVIDCDAVYHDLLKSSEDMLCEIMGAFPDAEVNGTLNRKALAAMVFSDSEALLRLNRITHCYVCDAVEELLRKYAMRGGTMAAIDAIELFSSGLANRCTTTCAILAEPETRARRIVARDHIDYDAAMARIRAQHPDSYYMENCDHTLWNNAEQEQFENNCRQLFKEITKNG